MIDFGKRGVLVLLLLLLGCTTPVEEPAAESSDLSPRSTEVVIEPTAVPPTVPTAAPPTLTAIPTATPQADETSSMADKMIEVLPTATIEVVEAVEEEVVFFGRTEEGALFRGAADAPLTLIDYSDFL